MISGSAEKSLEVIKGSEGTDQELGAKEKIFMISGSGYRIPFHFGSGIGSLNVTSGSLVYHF